VKCAGLLAVQLKFQSAYTRPVAPAGGRRECENARTNCLGASLSLAVCLEEFAVGPCCLGAKIAESLIDHIEPPHKLLSCCWRYTKQEFGDAHFGETKLTFDLRHTLL